jgi:hypothetical protein
MTRNAGRRQVLVCCGGACADLAVVVVVIAHVIQIFAMFNGARQYLFSIFPYVCAPALVAGRADVAYFRGVVRRRRGCGL